jgi:hypothetical protein
MGRFETRWLTAERNLAALADLSGQWIDRVHARRPPRGIVLDTDSSVSPTHGGQEMSVWNGTTNAPATAGSFVFNQFGDLERCSLRAGNVHSADNWDAVLRPVVVRCFPGQRCRISGLALGRSCCRTRSSVRMTHATLGTHVCPCVPCVPCVSDQREEINPAAHGYCPSTRGLTG